MTARQLPFPRHDGGLPSQRFPGPPPEPAPREGRHRAPGRDRPAPVQLVLLPGAPSGRGASEPAGPTTAPTTPPPRASRAEVAAAASFRQGVVLASVDPDRNRARRYLLTWQPGLWGGGTLTRAWGRIGKPGRSLTVAFDDREAAQDAIVALIRRRLRHGYRVVAWE